MKRITVCCLLLAMAMPLAAQAADTNVAALRVNGDMIMCSDGLGQPFVDHHQQMMVPLRLVNNSLGYDTKWQKDGLVEIFDMEKAPIASIDIKKKTVEVDKKNTLCESLTVQDGRCYVSVNDFDTLYGTAEWDSQEKVISVYPEKGFKQTYEVKDGKLIRIEGHRETVIKMPEVPPLEGTPLEESPLEGTTINGNPIEFKDIPVKQIGKDIYVGLLGTESPNNFGDIYKIDGKHATYIGEINMSSSYVVEDDVLYHTRGTDAGHFDSAELDPKQLILTDIKTGEEIKTIQVDFDINQCTLHMQNHKLVAVSPDGEHHVVNT